MYGYKKMYIDGKLVDAQGARKADVFCPATDEKIGEVAWATEADAEYALESAKRAFPSWSSTPIVERIAYMFKLRDKVLEHQELLREVEMFEHGKTYEQAGEGYKSIVEAMEYYAIEIQRLHGHLLVDAVGDYEHKVVYVSSGVVGAFVAWNFPLLNLAYKLGPALASGCPILIRPSTDTPISAYIIGELCHQIGFPPGVINILAGPVGETADVITRSKIPAMLTLIGSTATGRSVLRNGATSIKRYSMELGGNAPYILFGDANLDLAAKLATILKSANSGQNCIAPNRIFVHESIHDAFVEKVLSLAKKVVIGHGKDSGATMGPMINKKARDRIDTWVQEAIHDGAKLLLGGKIPPKYSTVGSYYELTILDQVTDSMRVFSEEVFGPVISISTFKEYDEVIERANNTDAGLSSFIFTNDISTIQKASHDLEFGEVQVNGIKYNIDLPHLGIKQSGIGQDCSHFALEDYMVKKRITTAIR